MVQHMVDTFQNPTDLDDLTKHITLKLFPFQRMKGAYLHYW